MNGEMSESPVQSTVSLVDKGVCWTIIHHLMYTEKSPKLTLEELEGLSKHVGNAIFPKDLTIVEETISVHYPTLMQDVRNTSWSSIDEIPSLFNVKQTTGV